jgi:hypothetical protein
LFLGVVTFGGESRPPKVDLLDRGEEFVGGLAMTKLAGSVLCWCLLPSTFALPGGPILGRWPGSVVATSTGAEMTMLEEVSIWSSALSPPRFQNFQLAFFFFADDSASAACD